MTIQNLAISAFVLVGGVGLLFKLAVKEVDPLVNFAFDELEQFPKVKQFLLDNRASIEELFDKVDAAAKARLEKDAAGPAPEQPKS